MLSALFGSDVLSIILCAASCALGWWMRSRQGGAEPPPPPAQPPAPATPPTLNTQYDSTPPAELIAILNALIAQKKLDEAKAMLSSLVNTNPPAPPKQ